MCGYPCRENDLALIKFCSRHEGLGEVAGAHLVIFTMRSFSKKLVCYPEHMIKLIKMNVKNATVMHDLLKSVYRFLYFTGPIL